MSKWCGVCRYLLIPLSQTGVHGKTRAAGLPHHSNSGAFARKRSVKVSPTAAIPSLASLVFNMSYKNRLIYIQVHTDLHTNC